MWNRNEQKFEGELPRTGFEIKTDGVKNVDVN